METTIKVNKNQYNLSCPTLSDAEKITLILIAYNSPVYLEDLKAVVGKSERQVIRIVNKLESEGFIKRCKGRAAMTVLEVTNE